MGSEVDDLLKEELLLKAVKNLRKKAQFLQLTVQMSEGQISEEEYADEIEKFPDKYVVDVEPLKDLRELNAISDIVKKINDPTISTNEVAEIFSIELSDIYHTCPNNLTNVLFLKQFHLIVSVFCIKTREKAVLNFLSIQPKKTNPVAACCVSLLCELLSLYR